MLCEYREGVLTGYLKVLTGYLSAAREYSASIARDHCSARHHCPQCIKQCGAIGVRWGVHGEAGCGGERGVEYSDFPALTTGAPCGTERA